MTKVGIYCPDWILARHNTDYKMARLFSQLQQYTDSEMSFVASDVYTWSFNLRRLANKLAGIKTSRVHHGLKKSGERVDLLYHYGSPVDPKAFFKMTSHQAVLVTTGFMTDRYVSEKLGKLPDRQKEADAIAATLEPATMLHFHTETGRQKFLQFRPEFAEKSVSIPFFLPNLSLFKGSISEKSKETIQILFVGNEGNRKGLEEIIEAFDILGPTYLNTRKVHVTIVSKDKPKPRCAINLTWHTKRTHEQVIDLMHEASIVTLVPKRESYGLVLIEAMMAGCAIITDDDDVRKEIIGDVGILLTSRTPIAIAAALKKLIENIPYREMLGQKAKLRADNLFSPDLVANQYNNCFHSLVKKPDQAVPSN